MAGRSRSVMKQHEETSGSKVSSACNDAPNQCCCRVARPDLGLRHPTQLPGMTGARNAGRALEAIAVTRTRRAQTGTCLVFIREDPLNKQLPQRGLHLARALWTIG